jgi:hypothetical protein
LLSIATSEARGPAVFGSQAEIASSAAVWKRESIVVWIVRPPSNAWRAPVCPPPSLSTTCCLIQDVK